jgi:hypothetical protein
MISGDFVPCPIDVGGGPRLEHEEAGILIVSYGPDGAYRWSRRIAMPPASVAIAPDGDVIATSTFADELDAGAGQLASAGETDVLVARFAAADGRTRWSLRFGGAGEDHAGMVATDAGGNAIVTWSFTGTVDFGLGRISARGRHEAIVIKISAAGAPLWGMTLGPRGLSEAPVVAVDRAGNVHVVN